MLNKKNLIKLKYVIMGVNLISHNKSYPTAFYINNKLNIAKGSKIL